MSSASAPRGQRLVPHIIDDIAQNQPERPYASLPHANWEKDGWYDITYAQYAGAVNRLARWLDSVLEPRETFVYVGLEDVRYGIVVGAAMKTRRPVVMPDPGISSVAQMVIVERAGASALVGPVDSNEDDFDKLKEAKPELKIIKKLPSLETLLHGSEDGSHYPYEVTFEKVKDDVAIVLHTSGTTGMPKIVPYTHRAWNVFDARLGVAKTTPPELGTVNLARLAGYRTLNNFRMAWLGGLSIVMQYSPFGGTVAIMMPHDSPRPLTVDYMSAIYRRLGTVDVAVHTPFIIRDMCKGKEGVELLSKVKFIGFAGAPLDEWVGNLLHERGVQIFGYSGSVEIDALISYLPPKDAWQFTRLHPMNGIVMEPVSKSDDTEEEYFEAVVYRQPHLEAFQSIFIKLPHIGDKFHTNDLYVRHTDPRYLELYKPAGRADDFVKTDNMAKFFVRPMESAAESISGVRAAIISGEGKGQPFIVIETDPAVQNGSLTGSSLADKVWEAITPHIQQYREELRPTRELMLVCDGHQKPFVRTGKGSINRRDTLKQYEDQIDALYAERGTHLTNGRA